MSTLLSSSARIVTLPDTDETVSSSLTSGTSRATVTAPTPVGPLLPHTSSSSTSVISTSLSSSASSVVSSISAAADSDDGLPSHSKSPPAGLIVGVLFAVLVVIGLILFFTRRYFILKRGQKTSATRARLSRIVISEPTNFQHLGTGRVNIAATGAGGAAQISGFTVSNHQAPSRENLREEDVVLERDESPKDRMKRKYSFDFGALESGLSDHVETMRKNQRAPTRI